MAGVRYLKVVGKTYGRTTIVRELTWEKGTISDSADTVEYYFFGNEYPMTKEDFDERYEIISEIEV